MNDSQPIKWERLLALLSDAGAAFHRFGSLLLKEEDALKHMNQQELNGVNSQKEHVLDVMCRLEQQIERELQPVSGCETPASMWSWLKDTQDPRAGSVHVLLTELQQVAHSIQVQGKHNENLLRRAHQKVCEAIHFMHTGWETGPVYQGSGTVNFPSVPGSVHLQG